MGRMTWHRDNFQQSCDTPLQNRPGREGCEKAFADTVMYSNGGALAVLFYVKTVVYGVH